MTTLNQIELLKRLTLSPGVSGFERGISEIMKNELGKSALFHKDNMGSITVVRILQKHKIKRNTGNEH